MKPDKNVDVQASKNHALYVAITQYLPNVMIAVVDTNLSIVFIEGEELQKVGLRKKAIEGKPIKEITNFSTQWKNRMMEYTQKTFEGNTFTYESRHKDKIYRVHTMPLHDEQQQIALVLFVCTNVTEQKRTEMEMFKALKKERELGELKSRFVSMASHEFRTPLSTILSAANLIARQNEPGNESERLRNVERIRSSVKNLIDILNEFLSLGHLEEGKISAKKEVFDIVEFMRSIVQELQHAQKPGQQVHISSQQQVIQVHLDKQFVRNIFLNLLSNALKYSPEGKPVDIIFMLLAPAESKTTQHLKMLAHISRFLKDDKTCAALRAAEEAENISTLLVEWSNSQAA